MGSTVLRTGKDAKAKVAPKTMQQEANFESKRRSSPTSDPPSRALSCISVPAPQMTNVCFWGRKGGGGADDLSAASASCIEPSSGRPSRASAALGSNY